MKESYEAKLRGYDAENPRSARIILEDRAKYDRPDTAFMLTWAEAVMRRLG